MKLKFIKKPLTPEQLETLISTLETKVSDLEDLVADYLRAEPEPEPEPDVEPEPENKTRLVQINTRDLPIGAVFYHYYDQMLFRPITVVTQGPDMIGIRDADGKFSCIPHSEYEYWTAAPPRTKVGDFKVGECFMKGGAIYEVSAVGRASSIVTYRGGVKDEFWFSHSDEVEAVEC